ncbi:MAG: 3-isopropylmalate dehydratase small subunit [Candidatus Ranarchaeia archaeon]|jgi:3-isopropylmalate/(R)-2-methylmalate dehydratase small subunit
MDKIKGRTWKFGDSISTTQIYPGRYLDLFDPKEIGAHAMEGVDPSFTKKVTSGDILVAGKNFGCGSSREQAIISLRAAGIQAIIAESFSRIFYRNSINQGIPPIIAKGFSKSLSEGDIVEINFETTTVINHTKNYKSVFTGFPPFIQNILEKGGLVQYIRSQLGVKNK